MSVICNNKNEEEQLLKILFGTSTFSVCSINIMIYPCFVWLTVIPTVVLMPTHAVHNN